VSDTYYLDTSVQIERHAGETAVRENLGGLLEGGGHATSTHVEREWKNIVHASAVAIVNACAGARAIADVHARLRQGFGRKPGHHWLALDMICGDPTTVAEIEIRAEQFLRTRGDVMFGVGLDEIRDGSACMLARESAHRDVRTGRWGIKTSCRREECACDQIAFTDANHDAIDREAEALAASTTSGHRTMARIARHAMAQADKTRRKGRACWGSNGLGGDISIALECGADKTLLTTDRSFDEICPAIGVTHVRVSGTRTP
jgi:hypothetical protein